MQATDDNMAQAHCMLDTKGYKYTHSVCVILIAFPLQQRLHERASMLRYTCIAFIVRDNLSDNSSVWGPSEQLSFNEVALTILKLKGAHSDFR
jgi:hypothetical protein